MLNKEKWLILDGERVCFSEGESLLEVAQRNHREIPTLCHDPKLDAFGGCRLCIVTVEGIRNPVTSCTTPAAKEMVVLTGTTELEQHRRVLLEMITAEQRQIKVDPLRGLASQELNTLVQRYQPQIDRFARPKASKKWHQDSNPFILRDYDLCISCYRCVRICDEVQGNSAINIMHRAANTQIATEFNGDLKDSACSFCGQCVHTCPTGALADRKSLAFAKLPEAIRKTRSICGYCGVGCSVDILTKGEKLIGIHPVPDGPANEGALCIKGQFAFDYVQHQDRLTTPLLRGADGKLHEVSWDEALDKAAEGFRRVQQKYGDHSIYAVASGRAPNEAAYAMQKFIRAGFGTHNVDNCSRT